ncbi:MAG: hypothetical protein EB060_04200 [Proteobacteria bacterium]|nr:hypothetical protein [Pseudomonadota bacterium]
MKLAKIKTRYSGDLSLGKVTVFVGPNNSGKSRALVDIHHLFNTPERDKPNTTVIIDNIEVEKPAKVEDLFIGLNRVYDNGKPERVLYQGFGPQLEGSDTFAEESTDVLKRKFDKNLDLSWAFPHLSKLWIATGQFIISTHNYNFLMGIISTNCPVDIFRLNRSDNITKITPIPVQDVANLTKSPILSSQRVLEAMFADGTIICEADSDRIIYQTVASQISPNLDDLFIHANDKQSIHKVVELISKTASPLAAIVDIDILNDQTNFQKLIEKFPNCTNASELIEIQKRIKKAIESQSDEEILDKTILEVELLTDAFSKKKPSLSELRRRLRDIEDAGSIWKPFKEKGIRVLPCLLRRDAFHLLKECKKFGLFIVPVGELESWIPLGVRKDRWINEALEKLRNGECPPRLTKFTNEVITYLRGRK